jgi:hypothetical protein
MPQLLSALLLPIRYEAGWSAEPVRMLGEEKYILPIPGSDHNPLDIQPIAQSLYSQCCSYVSSCNRNNFGNVLRYGL